MTSAAELSSAITSADLDLDETDLQYMLDSAADSLSPRLARAATVYVQGEGLARQVLWRLRTAWRICMRYLGEEMPDLESAEWKALADATARDLAARGR